MNITLQCAYCGSEKVKLPVDTPPDKLENMTIKCECGRFLIRLGIMGHQDNVKEGDRVRHIKHKCVGFVKDISKSGKKAYVNWDGIGGITAYRKQDLEVV